MEYYQVNIVYKGERVGIGYDPMHGVVWVGGLTRLMNHITPIALRYIKMPEDRLMDKTGVRQKNRFRYYCKMSDAEFRKGMNKLKYRYGISKIKTGIQAFT